MFQFETCYRQLETSGHLARLRPYGYTVAADNLEKMKLIAIMVGFLLAIPAAALAGDKPEAFTGSVDTADVAAKLGRHGVLFIRSADRWDEINKLVPNLKPDADLPNLHPSPSRRWFWSMPALPCPTIC